MPKKNEFADFEQTWDVPLMSTCVKLPSLFCFAFFCAPCFAYQQRSRLLDDDVSNRYVCCAGQICGDHCNKLTDPCPAFCLAVEAYRIQNTWLENCMIWCACITSWIRCIVSIFIDIPDVLDFILDCIYCLFQACLQSQQEHELDIRKPRLNA
eukprot:CFRG3288T1